MQALDNYFPPFFAAVEGESTSHGPLSPQKGHLLSVLKRYGVTLCPESLGPQVHGTQHTPQMQDPAHCPPSSWRLAGG